MAKHKKYFLVWGLFVAVPMVFLACTCQTYFDGRFLEGRHFVGNDYYIQILQDEYKEDCPSYMAAGDPPDENHLVIYKHTDPTKMDTVKAGYIQRASFYTVDRFLVIVNRREGILRFFDPVRKEVVKTISNVKIDSGFETFSGIDNWFNPDQYVIYNKKLEPFLLKADGSTTKLDFNQMLETERELLSVFFHNQLLVGLYRKDSLHFGVVIRDKGGGIDSSQSFPAPRNLDSLDRYNLFYKNGGIFFTEPIRNGRQALPEFLYTEGSDFKNIHVEFWVVGSTFFSRKCHVGLQICCSDGSLVAESGLCSLEFSDDKTDTVTVM